MEISFNGLGETAVASFKGSAAVNDVVTFGTGGTITKAAADKEFIGVCVSSRQDTVGVLLRGVVTVTYTGTAPVVGYNGFCTSGNNAVKVSDTAIKSLALAVDTTAKKVTILL